MLTDTRTCHLCEQVEVPLSSFFCEACFSIIRVGKLVYKMKDHPNINLSYSNNMWWVNGRLTALGWADTPEQALLNAGLTED